MPALFILAASMFDAVLTDAGLQLGLIGEANPLMRFVYDHAYVLYYPVKLSFPFLLLLLVPRIRSKRINKMVSWTAVAYVPVLALHLVWICFAAG